MRKIFPILVVDDDKEDQLILEDYFTDAGFTNAIRFTDNGLRAREYLESLQDTTQFPDLVVLDLNMPIMNGTQTLLWLKQSQRFKNIPVIIFSTSENAEEKRKCLNYGAHDYVVKPMNYDEGVRMVQKFTAFIEPD